MSDIPLKSLTILAANQSSGTETLTRMNGVLLNNLTQALQTIRNAN